METITINGMKNVKKLFKKPFANKRNRAYIWHSVKLDKVFVSFDAWKLNMRINVAIDAVSSEPGLCFSVSDSMLRDIMAAVSVKPIAISMLSLNVSKISFGMPEIKFFGRAVKYPIELFKSRARVASKFVTDNTDREVLFDVSFSEKRVIATDGRYVGCLIDDELKKKHPKSLAELNVPVYFCDIIEKGLLDELNVRDLDIETTGIGVISSWKSIYNSDMSIILEWKQYKYPEAMKAFDGDRKSWQFTLNRVQALDCVNDCLKMCSGQYMRGKIVYDNEAGELCVLPKPDRADIPLIYDENAKFMLDVLMNPAVELQDFEISCSLSKLKRILENMQSDTIVLDFASERTAVNPIHLFEIGYKLEENWYLLMPLRS